MSTGKKKYFVQLSGAPIWPELCDRLSPYADLTFGILDGRNIPAFEKLFPTAKFIDGTELKHGIWDRREASSLPDEIRLHPAFLRREQQAFYGMQRQFTGGFISYTNMRIVLSSLADFLWGIFQREAFSFGVFTEAPHTHAGQILAGIAEACDVPIIHFLDKDLNVAAFKVGSGEVENWDFIREVFSRGKPTIVSIGMYRQDQFTHLLELARSEELRQIAVLHCNTAYPTMPKHVNLLAMESLREQFDGPIGYSDHTEGHEIPLAAVALGAQVIEKHISIDFGLPDANDWRVSCGPEDFASFVTSLRKIEQARGLPRIEAQEHELESKLWARKSISASRTLEAGHTLRTSDLIMLRPGDGLSPERINDVLGRTLTAAKEFGDLITLADVD